MIVSAGGLAALTARDVGWGATAVIAAVGGAAAAMPHHSPQAADPRRWTSVVLLGVLAFGAVRALINTPLLHFSTAAALGGTVAAISEELFFRRFLYGWLSQWGVPMAILGSGVAFAAVHVPLYGLWAFPIDLGAGLLLGWQRWATGGWTAPTVTHVVANLLTLR
ncbi:MAG TPA: CPBP family intramembrane glutamic endopeptidase [Actinomycetota bacterium]|nr:CPBP family intramembrane glutamic endopeptidase [Actinomycetota bacterium]